ncbi:MAG TPA: 16S rRNA (uracil(1498)-N(3))-methyltransferase [Stellaceae bacterium]|nr:16S rRNA (uracil(1498)-N(3))-methyltransferase [Stellaceae bacterium]
MRFNPATRLHLEADLAKGLILDLSAAHTHRLQTVLRLKSGAVAAFFNGRDGEFLGRLDFPGKRQGRAELLEQIRLPRNEGDLWLAFAPVKRAPIDYLVEKATELGVSALRPVFTERTIVERLKLDRLRAHAIEAAEQSERLTVPELLPPLPLPEMIANWPNGRHLLLLDESGTSPPLREALSTWDWGQESGRDSGSWGVLVGPEGGFTQSELDALKKLPFVCAAGLGPRVLRADTAALAGLAAFQALIGDWRGTPV